MKSYLSFLSVLACLGVSAPARAHFVLVAPANEAVKNGLGDPQKSAPCGQDDGVPYQLTGDVTTVAPGSTLRLVIDETIFHPGHYRVAIAQDHDGLPADPPVTPGATDCGSTVIDSSPALPLLADGLLVHTTRFSGQQTMDVTLPAGFTCDNCVLQVVEFMSSHGAPCFYHQCARVTVTGAAGTPDAGATPPDAGAPAPAADAAAPGEDDDIGAAPGCGCRVGTARDTARGTGLAGAGLALGLLALVGARRRARR